MTRARRAVAIAIAALVPAFAASCHKKAPRAVPAPTASGTASLPLPPEDDADAPQIDEIDLSIGAPEVRKPSLFSSEHGSYFDLVDALEHFRDDDDVKGLFLRFGGRRIGWARATEIARTLESLREHGKRVTCHADELSNATYYLASQGCDRIWVSPAGDVDTIGIATELLFAKDLLGKLGIEADVEQVGTYKGVADMVTRSSPSDDVKQSVQGALSDIRARWLEGVEVGRHKHELKKLLENGPYGAEEAKSLGLVDEVGYADDAKTELRRSLAAGRTDVLFGRGAHADEGGGLVEIVRVITGAKRPGTGGPAHVSVLRATGAIAMEPGGSVLGSDVGIDARTMTKQLRALAKDDATKAVVLRIDSPGGSALASDIIWHEIMALRKKKPVVVSVGDMAASGGYYLACAGTKIVAEETSIVGSIGVVGGKLAVGNALRQIGVNVEPLPAEPGADATRAAYLSPFTPWDDATRARVRATMTSTYDLFVRRIVEGRNLPREKVESFAEGRIFSGRTARALGMVDAWGGIADAIDLAKTEAKLPGDAEIRLVGGSGGLFEALGLEPEAEDARANRTAAELAKAVLPDAEVLWPYAESMGPLAAGERALVAVPFAILIRLHAVRRLRLVSATSMAQTSDPSAPPTEGDAPRRATLPPPEWQREPPASAGSAALAESLKAPPVARRSGPRAEYAWQKARLQEARRAKDREIERSVAASLARWLAVRSMEIDTAIRLARRALAIGDDPALRAELAAWLVGIGEHALAASDLRMVADAKGAHATARDYTKVGDALARAADPAAAADALRRAAEVDPASPVPLEVLGSLAVWAPDVVRPEVAAAAFAEAAQRRARLHDNEAAFEDRLRAFDLAKHDGALADAVSAALASRGRIGAADEILRAHAEARGREGSAVHARRMRDALAANDVPRAIGAALDADLDAVLDGPEAFLFDEALARAGLFDWLAIRLELRAERAEGRARARAYGELARLLAESLASPDRAVEAWTQALVADPGDGDALAALRAHATAMHDPFPLVEALLRAGDAEDEPTEARIASYRELAIVAESMLAEPSLALFALDRLAALGAADDDETNAARARFAARVRLQDDALAQAEAALGRADETGDRAARIEALRRLASLLRGRAGDAERYLDVIRELARALPDERGWMHAFERVATRLGRLDELADMYVARASGGTQARSDIVRARLALAWIRRRQGRQRDALREAAVLLDQASSHRAAASTALTLAALEGDDGLRADALAQLAAALTPALRAVLLAVASDAARRAADDARARSLAEQACQADPALPRAVASLAASLSNARDRAAASALERAAGVLVPGATLCRDLASTLEGLGDTTLSIAWTQRWLALRPGDPEPTRELLRRASLGADAARLSDAIAWVLTIPAPASAYPASIAAALRALSEKDPSMAVAVARRAADVLGSRDPDVRAAIVDVVRRAGDHALAAAVLERWVASGASSEDRVEALLAIAEARRAQGDAFGEARALLRSLREGADAADVAKRIDESSPGSGSDAVLARLEARAEALALLGGERAPDASEAWREVGAARWDLAADPPGAVRAWVRAAELEPRHGPARLVRDLFAFGGPERALDELLHYAENRAVPQDAALVLTLAAMAAIEGGKPAQAFEAARRAVLLDPSRTDALAIAERAAEAVGGFEALDALYDAIADASLGMFGRRAAHYRAARQLERRGLTTNAARHAIRAFEAVPSVGMTYVLMSRLTQRAGTTGEAVAAIERVADDARDDYERADWLHRAASLATDGEEGARQRVDVLLRALHVRPDTFAVREVGEALATLVRVHGEDPDAAELRFERALKSATKRLEGPEGARVAIAFADAALRSFSSPRVAIAALKRAIGCDADLDEYGTIAPSAGAIAETEKDDPANGFSEAVRTQAKKPYSNVGPAALRLAGTIALARDDDRAAAELVVAAARRAPEDVALVAEAEKLVAKTGDTALRDQLHDAFPVARRLEALLHVADEEERSGDPTRGAAALERAFAIPDLAPDVRVGIRKRLAETYLRLRRRDALEALLAHELGRADLSTEEHVAIARDLAPLLAARGDADRALSILTEAARTVPDSAELWSEIADVARQAGDRTRLVDALGRLVELTRDDEGRVAAIRQLATALEEAEDLDGAAERWKQLATLDPTSRDALAAMERIAMARGDHETLAEVLAQRIALGGSNDDVRVLRLRRAALLEQRLGRVDDARIELEKLIEQVGDDPSATRFLADLHERLGAPLRAAPLWMRAFHAQADPRDKAELAARAAQAYLKGGDVHEARAAVEQALLLSRSEKLLEIRVELERVSGNSRGLADALDELAIASMDPPERRADLLVEAAHASLASNEDLAALERAQRAARVAPTSVPAQLLARLLEYRARGAGTPQEASGTIEDLRRISSRVTPEDAPLHAFLLAEALDVVHGQNAGMRELTARHAELGAAPLIALGIAERLSRTSSFQAALPFFDAALSGELHGVRRRGSIALAAADAAYRVDDLERASRYLEEAAADPVTVHTARQRQASIAEAVRARAEALVPDERRTLQELAIRAVGIERARALAQLARLMAKNPSERAEADRFYGDAIAAAALDPQLVLELEGEREMLRGVPRTSSRPPPPTPSNPPAVPSSPPAAVSSSPPASIPSSPPASERPSARASERPAPVASSGAPESQRPPPSMSSPPSERPERFDATADARRAVLQALGDHEALAKLRDAALVDKNYPYARAVDHVLRAFTLGAEPIAPPPLAAQREHPDLIHRFLMRGSGAAVREALAIVWDAAPHLFRREAGNYGVTGLDRVSFGAATAASRVYTAAARLLGTTRTPLFQRRASGALSASVALLVPPAVVLAGDPRDETPELLYRMGFALVSAMPEHALLFALPEAQLRNLLAAVVLAFGPAQTERKPQAAVAVLAESLWQAIPARAQRRLGELCVRVDEFAPERATADTRRAARRAGLFVCGDLGVAIREVVVDEGLALERSLEAPDGLAHACSAHPQIADLLVLATSAEYADARWQSPEGRLRARSSSGTLRVRG